MDAQCFVLGFFGLPEFVSKVPQPKAKKFIQKHELPDNAVPHPTTRSQNTSLLDDYLVRISARCRMRDLVIVICKDLVIRSYAIR